MPASIGALTQSEFEALGGQLHSKVVLLSFDNGHSEASITRYRTVSDVPDSFKWFGQRPPLLDACGNPLEPSEVLTKRGEGDREESVRRAARRSKSKARIRCKASGFDSLFTFTYRANVTDRELVASHWKETVRRIRRVLPEFSYLAVLEKQKRGAWHVHVATHRLPASLTHAGCKVKSWSVLRAIWLSVVGDLGGNFDESKRRSRSRASSLKIARYITKYIGKDFEDGELNRKRYWAGGEWQAPRRVVMLFPRSGDSIDCELLGMVFEEVVESGAEFTHWLHSDGHTYWVASLSP